MPSDDAKTRPLWKMKRVWLAAIALLAVAGLSSCSGARMMMQTAPASPKGAAASPPIEAANISEWESQKPAIKAALEQEIYGVMPREFGSSVLEILPLDGSQYTTGIAEVTIVAEGLPNRPRTDITYKAVLVTPEMARGPVPIIMMENFCPNHNVIPGVGVSRPPNMTFSCDGSGIMGSLMTFAFGRYIAAPPIDMILKAGYGLAVIYPPATFPDNAADFEAVRQSPPDAEHPWGAVGAWAYQYSSLSDALGTLGYDTTIAYGHSRYGKAALVAAAFDETIDGVISHQSGTGGASLSRGKKGETIDDITESYPHWFTPNYIEAALTYDQHHLLALVAPRPVLLGNAKRDVWSDPEGAFRAAQGATPAYELYGLSGLRQKSLTGFDPNADIAFWMRPGTHGVVKEDWPAFLDFMNAHFGP